MDWRGIGVRIMADDSDHHRGVTRAAADQRAFGKSVDDASRVADAGFKKTEKSASTMGSNVKKVFAGLALVGLFHGVIAEGQEAQKVSKQSEAVIRSTGGAAGVSARQFGDLATSISKYAGIDDEVIQDGENMLATFTNIKNNGPDKTFDRATRAAVDMGVAMKTGPREAALMLGKALQDPEHGLARLTRSGVVFTQGQKDLVKSLQDSGQMAKAQAVILGEVEKEFGGSAAAQATDIDKATVAFKNAEESIAGALAPAIKTLSSVVEVSSNAFSGQAKWLQQVELFAGSGAVVWLKYGDSISKASTWLKELALGEKAVTAAVEAETVANEANAASRVASGEAGAVGGGVGLGGRIAAGAGSIGAGGSLAIDAAALAGPTAAVLGWHSHNESASKRETAALIENKKAYEALGILQAQVFKPGQKIETLKAESKAIDQQSQALLKLGSSTQIIDAYNQHWLQGVSAQQAWEAAGKAAIGELMGQLSELPGIGAVFDAEATGIEKATLAYRDGIATANQVHLINTKRLADAQSDIQLTTNLHAAVLDLGEAQKAQAENAREQAGTGARQNDIRAKAAQQARDDASAIRQAERSHQDSLRGLDAAYRQVGEAEHSRDEAVRSLAAAERGVGEAEHGRVEAVRGMASALRQVDDAEHSRAEALRGVESAERSLQRTQADSIRLERDLITARRDAQRQLISASLGARGDKLGVESARLALADAQRELATPAAPRDPTDTTPVDPNEYAKKVLAVQQAQLAYEQAVQQAKVSTEDLTDSQKKGVDGSDAVISAQTAIKDNAQSIADGQHAVSEANRGVASADLAVEDAHHGVAEAGRAVAASNLALLDAQHSVAEAARGVAAAEQGIVDARAGVVTADQAVADSAKAVGDARIKAKDDQQIAQFEIALIQQQAVKDAGKFADDTEVAMGRVAQAGKDAGSDLKGVYDILSFMASKSPELMAQLAPLLAMFNPAVYVPTIVGGLHAPGANVGERRWGGIDHYAKGGTRDAMVGSGRNMVWWDEPETGGEAYIPRLGDKGKSREVLRTAARWYGMSLVEMASGGLLGGHDRGGWWDLADTARQPAGNRPGWLGGTGANPNDLLGRQSPVVSSLGKLTAAQQHQAELERAGTYLRTQSQKEFVQAFEKATQAQKEFMLLAYAAAGPGGSSGGSRPGGGPGSGGKGSDNAESVANQKMAQVLRGLSRITDKAGLAFLHAYQEGGASKQEQLRKQLADAASAKTVNPFFHGGRPDLAYSAAHPGDPGRPGYLTGGAHGGYQTDPNTFGLGVNNPLTPATVAGSAANVDQSVQIQTVEFHVQVNGSNLEGQELASAIRGGVLSAIESRDGFKAINTSLHFHGNG